MRPTPLFWAAVALWPALAFATATDVPLTKRDFIAPKPLEPTATWPNPHDFLPVDYWVYVRMPGGIIPVLVTRGFPLPYPPCWESAQSSAPCILDDDSANPPRP